MPYFLTCAPALKILHVLDILFSFFTLPMLVWSCTRDRTTCIGQMSISGTLEVHPIATMRKPLLWVPSLFNKLHMYGLLKRHRKGTICIWLQWLHSLTSNQLCLFNWFQGSTEDFSCPHCRASGMSSHFRVHMWCLFTDNCNETSNQNRRWEYQRKHTNIRGGKSYCYQQSLDVWGGEVWGSHVPPRNWFQMIKETGNWE